MAYIGHHGSVPTQAFIKLFILCPLLKISPSTLNRHKVYDDDVCYPPLATDNIYCHILIHALKEDILSILSQRRHASQ